MLRAFLLLALLALATVCVRADNYAVLVAGSNTYSNYRHQADVCHAYKLLRKYGVPESNIITFLFDDVAWDPSNPFPGRLFNHPTNNHTRGVDVYKGCGGSIEANVYRGADVMPDVFMAVITGNVSGVPAGKTVLKSTHKDDVFVNFVDHGSPGTIYFPNFVPFQATTLISGLQTMYDKKMYNQLVFYLEACEAGSVFDQQLPNNTNIYAVTASNTDESSWGTYCPGSESENGGAMVDGVDIDSCLGDLFSVNWMEDSDRMGVKESLRTQFVTVQNLTSLSHVMQYGSTSFTNLPTGTFIGGIARSLRRLVASADESAASSLTAPKVSVKTRDVPLHILYNKYKKAATSAQRRAAMAALTTEVDMRSHVDSVFERFAEAAAVSAGQTAQSSEVLFDMPYTPIVHDQCMNAVEAVWRGECGGWNDYSTQYGAVIINACRLINDGALLAKHMRASCTA